MMYLNFSALETALLPYFLFVAYGAILLWVRSVREGAETAPDADRNDVSVIDYGESEQTEFALSIPDPLADEFERELVNRVTMPMNDAEYIQSLSPISKPVTRKRRPKSISEFIALEFEQSGETHTDKV